MDMNNIGAALKKLAAGTLIVVLCAMAGFGLLLLAHTIPAQTMAGNLERSKATLVSEGKRAHAVKWCHSSVDNSTNSKMLLIAAYDGDEGVLERTLMNYRHIWDFEDGPSDTVPEESEVIRPYGRYWHGYEIWLRPLLALTDLRGIRVVNLICQLALVAAVAWALVRRGLRELVLPYLVMWGVMVPFALWRTLTLCSIFYIMNLSMLFLLLDYDRLLERNRMWLVFLLSGIMVAYFDFLTYPLAALTGPLVLQQYLGRKRPLKARLRDIVVYSLVWAAGYGGMWACKWILGQLLSGYNFLGDAAHQILFRSSSESTTGGYASVLKTWIRNLGPVAMNPITYLGIAYGAVLLVRAVRSRRVRREDVAVFVLIAVMPFVWYAVVRNHSYIHVHFTSKALAVSAFSLLCLFSIPREGGRDAQR